MFTELLGRKITHIRTTVDKLTEAAISHGYPPGLAATLCNFDENIANGSEEALVGKSTTITGKHELKDFLEENKSLWIV